MKKARKRVRRTLYSASILDLRVKIQWLENCVKIENEALENVKGQLSRVSIERDWLRTVVIDTLKEAVK
jgi:hypothetical protein